MIRMMWTDFEDRRIPGYDRVSAFDRAMRLLFRRRHVWSYRNPYTRHCVKCGTIEDQFRWAWESRGSGGWETVHFPEVKYACKQRNDVP